MDNSKVSWLMTPGPVPISPQVLEALSEPALHHRTPTFEKILSETLQSLKAIFKTQQPCFILTATGSGAMEAALVNVLSPGDHVLSIVGGKFGERWADMAEAYGAQVDRFQVEWGHPPDLHLIENKLQTKNYKLLMCQACETSTGFLFPINALAQLVKNTPTLFAVDAITALGCTSLPMDEWGIDIVVAGSQKAFQLPTGLSFISLSEKAWEAQRNSKCPKFYFDLAREKKANSQNQTYFSSPVSLIKGLHVFLKAMIAEGGVEQLIQLHHKRAAAFRATIQSLGYKIFPQSPSDSLTVIELPPGIDGKKLRLHLEHQGLIVMGGQDQLECKVLRFGHMGYMLPEHLWSAIEILFRESEWLHHSTEHYQSQLANGRKIFEGVWKNSESGH